MQLTYPEGKFAKLSYREQANALGIGGHTAWQGSARWPVVTCPRKGLEPTMVL